VCTQRLTDGSGAEVELCVRGLADKWGQVRVCLSRARGSVDQGCWVGGPCGPSPRRGRCVLRVIWARGLPARLAGTSPAASFCAASCVQEVRAVVPSLWRCAVGPEVRRRWLATRACAGEGRHTSARQLGGLFAQVSAQGEAHRDGVTICMLPGTRGNAEEAGDEVLTAAQGGARRAVVSCATFSASWYSKGIGG